jgi:hypothetical protein
MRNFTIATILGITATTTGMMLVATPANAADLLFNIGTLPDTSNTFSTGILPDPNAIVSYLFTLDSNSTVTFQSYSWGGGTNAAGAAIAPGGFDPLLTLFDDTTGGYIIDQPDTFGTSNLDFQLVQDLAAGNYRAVISAAGNFANAVDPSGNFSDGFSRSAAVADFVNVTSEYAFNIKVTKKPATTVPEPSDLIGTVVAGFTVVMLRRRLSSSKQVRNK